MERRTQRYAIFLLGLAFGYLGSSYLPPVDKVETRFVKESGEHVGVQRSTDMSLFWDVWEAVNQSHVYEDEVNDTDDRVEGAIRGMLQSLDAPYTLFMNEEETKEF